MELLDEILGKYKYSEIDAQSGFGNEFLLDIRQDEEGKIRFSFEMATIGVFGKMGETWKGKGVSRGDHLALIIEEQINWVENDDGQRTESTDEKLDTLPIELYPHFDTVAIYHKKLEKIIQLKKAED